MTKVMGAVVDLPALPDDPLILAVLRGVDAYSRALQHALDDDPARGTVPADVAATALLRELARNGFTVTRAGVR